jgi:hypothetical protein
MEIERRKQLVIEKAPFSHERQNQRVHREMPAPSNHNTSESLRVAEAQATTTRQITGSQATKSNGICLAMTL